MVVLSKQVFKSIKYNKSEYSTKSHSFDCFVRILLTLIICSLISGLHSEELKIDRNRNRVNDRINDNNYDILSNSRNNWWQKKVDKRPTLVVKDEPIGTGVPTWKEIDIYGPELRKGRSFAYKTENSSAVDNRFVASVFVITALNLYLYLH